MKKNIPGWLGLAIIVVAMVLMWLLVSYLASQEAAEEEETVALPQPLEELQANMEQATDELQLFLAYANGEEHRTIQEKETYWRLYSKELNLRKEYERRIEWNSR